MINLANQMFICLPTESPENMITLILLTRILRRFSLSRSRKISLSEVSLNGFSIGSADSSTSTTYHITKIIKCYKSLKIRTRSLSVIEKKTCNAVLYLAMFLHTTTKQETSSWPRHITKCKHFIFCIKPSFKL